MLERSQIIWLIIIFMCYSICLHWFYKKMKKDLEEDEKNVDKDGYVNEE